MKVHANFHERGKLVKGSNASFIVIIPKKDGACRIDHFRPISLIGSLYKIISKILARLLKLVTSSLIGESQSTFLRGWHILDEVVILNEAVEETKKSKKKLLVFKVDFDKAYDSVDWEYLMDLLAHMSFPMRWLS